MKDFITQIAVEDFTNKVADKVIERGADKIAESVVEKIKPILTKSNTTSQKIPQDTLLTREETAKILKMSHPTLRGLYTNGTLKAYGLGTRHIRFKESEVMAALDTL
ncbi:MAG: helix-turn-helix domain-containing protein [Saprospiraceae bacterium]|nr:helix-turn-helix domain-containing protein [Saprospiraceae bacterium]